MEEVAAGVTTTELNPAIAHELAVVKRKIRDSEETVLKANPNRYVIFPIEHGDLWKMAQDHISVFWRPEELD